ncbi:MAG: T9SS type A sorting domain-containing protein [bacterium]
MKTTLFFCYIILIYIFSYQYSISQVGPNWTIDCDNACINNEYGYYFCKIENGKPKKVFKCTADPHNEPGLTLMMPSLSGFQDGFCFNYVGNYTALGGDGIISVKPNGEYKFIFVPDKISDYIIKAMKKWYDCCNSHRQEGQDKFQYINPANNCCINIRWSNYDEANRFLIPDYTNPDYKYYIALTYAAVAYTSDNCNSLNCAKQEIVLNQIDDWINDPGPGGWPQRFYYMDEKPSQSTINKNNLIYYSFYSVLLHEIGHWFGIPDEDDIESCSFWNLYSGTMKGEIYAWEDRDLSEDDCCMFSKLYCCTQSMVKVEELCNEDNLNFRFTIFPNPLFENTVNVKLDDIKLGEKFLLNIYDNQGNQVFTKSFNNAKFNLFEVNKLSNDIYFVEIIYKNKKYVKKIALIK